MESSFPNFSQSLSLHRLSAQRTFQAMTNYPIIWRSLRISKWIEFQTHSLADVHADCVNKANQKHFRKSTMAINESMGISKWMREKNQHIFPIVIAVCPKCVRVCKKKTTIRCDLYSTFMFIYGFHFFLPVYHIHPFRQAIAIFVMKPFIALLWYIFIPLDYV